MLHKAKLNAKRSGAYERLEESQSESKKPKQEKAPRNDQRENADAATLTNVNVARARKVVSQEEKISYIKEVFANAEGNYTFDDASDPKKVDLQYAVLKSAAELARRQMRKKKAGDAAKSERRTLNIKKIVESAEPASALVPIKKPGREDFAEKPANVLPDERSLRETFATDVREVQEERPQESTVHVFIVPHKPTIDDKQRLAAIIGSREPFRLVSKLTNDSVSQVIEALTAPGLQTLAIENVDEFFSFEMRGQLEKAMALRAATADLPRLQELVLKTNGYLDHVVDTSLARTVDRLDVDHVQYEARSRGRFFAEIFKGPGLPAFKTLVVRHAGDADELLCEFMRTGRRLDWALQADIKLLDPRSLNARTGYIIVSNLEGLMKATTGTVTIPASFLSPNTLDDLIRAVPEMKVGKLVVEGALLTKVKSGRASEVPGLFETLQESLKGRFEWKKDAN